MFLWQFCGRSNKVVVPTDKIDSTQEYYSNLLDNNNSFIKEEDSSIEQDNAKKYGITVKRYKTIMRTKGMHPDFMDFLHNNGWDFTDTSKDILLIATLNNPDLDISTDSKT